MSVTIECPSCHRTIRAPDSIVGRQAKCPACQTVFNVTAAPPEPPPLAQMVDDEAPRIERPRRKPSILIDFLVFRRMITPIIIQVLFWLGVLATVITGLVLMIASLFVYRHLSDALFGMLMGLLILLLGPFLVRIYCELLILAFRMNETLTEIKNSINRLRRD
jgi:hypothetical protein